MSAVVALVLSAGVLTAGAVAARPAVAAGGVQLGGRSIPDGISADGRFVLFHSSAGGQDHLFVRDRGAARTEQADLTASEVPSGFSFFPRMAATGRFVAFQTSVAAAPGDMNGAADVYLRDLRRRTTELVSVATGGGLANGTSWPAGVSGDGRYVVFQSTATNLDPADTSPPTPRSVYVRDRALGSTHRIAGIPFESLAPGWSAIVSADGLSVATDTREPAAATGFWGVTLYDLAAGTSQRISRTPGGGLPNADVNSVGVSRGGRFVALSSFASNLVAGDTDGVSGVFVRDVHDGVTQLVTRTPAGGPANGGSFGTDLSADGNVVVFISIASNLVPGDTNGRQDVFVGDLDSGRITRVDVAGDGSQTTGEVGQAWLSADGRFVAYYSSAATLVPGDTNGVADAFVYDTANGATERVSLG